MASQKMIVNGIDLSTFECWVDEPVGWADGPHRRERIVDVQAAGEILIPGGGRMPGRRWQVQGSIIAPTQPDAQDLLDIVKLHLMGGWLEVMILPWTDRMCVCRYESLRWARGKISDDAFGFTMVFYSPSAYLVAPQVDPYGVTPAAETELILGTAPSPFVAEFIGPASQPTLTYYDANGTARGFLKLVGDLALGDWLHYNSQTGLMTRSLASGAVSDGAGFLGDESREFVLDPHDGVPERGPVVVVDSGSVLLYTRRCFA